jgi:hypothetical protein
MFQLNALKRVGVVLLTLMVLTSGAAIGEVLKTKPVEVATVLFYSLIFERPLFGFEKTHIYMLTLGDKEDEHVISRLKLCSDDGITKTSILD